MRQGAVCRVFLVCLPLFPLGRGRASRGSDGKFLEFGTNGCARRLDPRLGRSRERDPNYGFRGGRAAHPHGSDSTTDERDRKQVRWRWPSSRQTSRARLSQDSRAVWSTPRRLRRSGVSVAMPTFAGSEKSTRRPRTGLRDIYAGDEPGSTWRSDSPSCRTAESVECRRDCPSTFRFEVEAASVSSLRSPPNPRPCLFAAESDHPQSIAMRSSRILQDEFAHLLAELAGTLPSRLTQL